MSNRIPPQALELECAILGAMLQSEEAVYDVLDIVKTADVFYEQKHGYIFSAIKELISSSKPVDLLTVSDSLKRSKKLTQIGGDHYLIGLAQKISSGAHSGYHARIVLQKYIMRRIIKLTQVLDERAYREESDIFKLLDELDYERDKINNIIQNNVKLTTWEEAVLEVPKRVELLSKNKDVLTGMDTGLDNINRHFGGWQNTDLIIIGADSGMGKTALAMTHILAAAKKGNAVGVFSMEMSTLQLAIRGVSVESDFHMRQLTQNGFDNLENFKDLSQVVEEIKVLPIHIDDSPSLTINELKRKAKDMKRKHDIKLFVIDFIQMFAGDEDDIKLAGLAARELKNLAKELNIPVIALSQLNREVKKSKYCIPSKHHLKNSSGLEEAADVIGLIYRPSYYGHKPERDRELYQDLNLKGNENAVFIVAKNRNGGLGDIPLCYVENKTKYINP